MFEFLSDITNLLPWLVVLICICGEAFFAASELSILSADKLNLEALAEQGSPAAKRVLWFKAEPSQLFGTTLLGTNISMVTASTIASLTLIQVNPEEGEFWAMLIMSPLALMGGEIIPKTMAQTKALTFALLLSKPLYLFNWILTPAIWLVQKYTNLISRVLKYEKTQNKGVSRDEFIYLVKEEGEIEQDERDLISRIMEFKQAMAEDVMIPLAEMVAIPKNSTVRESIELINQEGYSRIPVYENRIDQVIGVLYHLDLMNAQSADENIEKYIRPVLFVTENQELEDMLQFLQKSSASLAVVVDEFGGAVGLITLEDVIEEIVGEIEDEYDQEVEYFEKISPLEYIVEARMSIELLNERFHLDLPLSEEYESLAGYLLDKYKKLPDVGDERISERGDQFIVYEVSDRAIEKVRIVILPENVI